MLQGEKHNRVRKLQCTANRPPVQSAVKPTSRVVAEVTFKNTVEVRVADVEDARPESAKSFQKKMLRV